jgi:hypothetical protein
MLMDIPKRDSKIAGLGVMSTIVQCCHYSKSVSSLSVCKDNRKLGLGR